MHLSQWSPRVYIIEHVRAAWELGEKKWIKNGHINGFWKCCQTQIKLWVYRITVSLGPFLRAYEHLLRIFYGQTRNLIASALQCELYSNQWGMGGLFQRKNANTSTHPGPGQLRQSTWVLRELMIWLCWFLVRALIWQYDWWRLAVVVPCTPFGYIQI